MPSPATSIYSRRTVCTRCGFPAFYSTLIFFSLHAAIVMYINSSFATQFFGAQAVSLLYIAGFLLSLPLFFFAPSAINRIGNIWFIVIAALVEALMLLGLAFTQTAALLLPLFIFHLATVPIIYYAFDILLEGLVGTDESTTGGRRGLFLAIGAFTLACAAWGTGQLMGTDTPNYQLAYIASAAFLVPFLLLLVFNFSKYVDPAHPKFKVIETISAFWHRVDVRRVFFASFLLQFFFSWMVIYVPVHLATQIGFNWEEIGSILFVALMAYVLLEYPIGYLADNYFGEKEMMALGFVIMSLSVSSFVFLNEASIFSWMVALFMTRVGAAFVETTTESYFFKHTGSGDLAIVGIFRIAQPLGYILGPVLGGILLFFFPLSTIFIILGICMLPGFLIAASLHDTL